MPNHVTTVCTVTGPEHLVKAFHSAHIRASDTGTEAGTGDDEKVWFDFEAIIPKPAILNGTISGSDSHLGVMALVGDVVQIDFTTYQWIPKDVLAGPPFGHARAVRAWLEKESPKTIVEGKKCLQAIVETGYPTWYEWSIANWGTKWGAYSYAEVSMEPGRLVFKFDTAWSFPEPIFRKLATTFPELTFSVVSFDEGWNFACQGEFNGQNNFHRTKATAEIYQAVYGEPPDRDQDQEVVS